MTGVDQRASGPKSKAEAKAEAKVEPVGRRNDAALLARGVGRLLVDMGYSVLTELRVGAGRRVDMAGCNARGAIVIVEIKSSVADFRGDKKWRCYLPYCDSFYFAVAADFPLQLLPQDSGLIVADSYGAEVIRPAPVMTMNGNRRRSLTLRFARAAADRLRDVLEGDPAAPVSQTRPQR